MNCPTCDQPMHTREIQTYTIINGRRWPYFYDEMVCDDHPQQAWQTPEQRQANLDAIKAVRERAQTKKPAP